MRILLVRHGYSEGNHDTSKYHEKGDQNIGLTETGWNEAYQAGKFLKDYYLRNNENPKWPHIFLSPYTRTRETMSGILRGMEGYQETPPKFREDPRLVEKFFGAASALEYTDHEDIPPSFKKGLQALFKLVYHKDPFSTSGLFGESQKNILNNVKGFIDGTLDRDIREGAEDILIVTHGAVIQAFLMSWFHIRMDEKTNINNPDNCDIIAITGEPKNWRADRIYRGEIMLPTNEPWLEDLHSFTPADLPKFPEHILK